MKKKVNNIFRSLLLLCFGCAWNAALADNVVVADANGNQLIYSYTEATGNATFTGVDSYSADAAKAGRIIIADEVTDADGNTHQVTAVGSSLSNRDNLVSVVIPSHVTSVGDYAFNYCTKLTSFIVSATEVTWGSNCFSYTDNIQHMELDMKTIPNNFYYNHQALTELVLGTHVEAIGNSAFQNAGLTSLTLGENVTSIGSGAFQGNASLQSVTFNTKLTAIPDNCFNHTGLTSVTIPNTITSIGSSAFYNCSNLASVTIGTGVTTVGGYAFSYCGSLTSMVIRSTDLSSWASTCFSYTDNIQHMELDMKTIPNSFYARQALTELVLGTHVETIGNNAFQSAGLESLTLGENVTSIGNSAFQDNTSLQSVTFNTKLNAIPDNCFNHTGLTSVTIPNTITSIGSSAFYNCPNLASVTIGTGVTSVGGYAFCYCGSLTSMVIHSSDLSSWGSNCFSYTDNIQHMELDMKDIPGSFYEGRQTLTELVLGTHVETIGNYAFQNTRLTSLELGASVTSIGNSAFQGNTSLQSVDFNDQLQTIGANAFHTCDLLSLDVPSSVTSIGNNAFYSNQHMTTATIGDGVTTVGSYAFERCIALRDITFGTALTSFGSNPFSYDTLNSITFNGATVPSGFSANSDVIIFVPSAYLTTYLNNSTTNPYRIVELGNTTDFIVITTDGGKLQEKVEQQGNVRNVMKLKVSGPINGTDIEYIHHYMTVLYELDLGEAQIVTGGESYHAWYYNTTTPTINNNYAPFLTEKDVVGKYMFYNMRQLKRLVLPASATVINDYAVYNCTNLTDLTLPTAPTSIGKGAFQETGITSITLPSSITEIPESMCHNCNQLVTISLPDAVTVIGKYAFSQCDVLTTFNLPASLTTIEQEAFYNDNQLATALTFPDGLETIGPDAFNHCYVIPSVTFNQGLKTIGDWAFKENRIAVFNQLPSSVTTLGKYVFQDCDALIEMTLPAAITAVPDQLFYQCDNLERVTLAEGTTSIGNSAFSECKVLSECNYNQSTLTTLGNEAFRNTAFQTVTLPNSITEIGYNAFAYCQQLTSINVPTGISYVPNSFVRDCPVLTNVNIPAGITTIRESAFRGCPMLTTLTLNDNITEIRYDAFFDCTSLALTALPANLQTIGSSAFRNCKAFTTLTLPATLTSMGNDAFRGSGLTAITFTAVPTTFGTDMFYDCDKLTLVNLPDGLTTLPGYTFGNCTSLTNISLPASLTEIGERAFLWTRLTSIDIPETVTTIGRYAFEGTALTVVRIPNSVTTMQERVFQNCMQLTAAYMGRNMSYTQVSDFSYFYGCSNLRTLRVFAGTPPGINSSYAPYYSECTLQVPEDALSLYQEANVWKNFKTIETFYTGDVLAEEDFAVMQALYLQLDGDNWTHRWDLTNNHRSVGKWYGVTFDGDYISSIDLSAQGVKGTLGPEVFTLVRLQTLNLSDNQIDGDLGTLLPENFINTKLDEVNLTGNQFTGDLYPFASKLPNVTKLYVAYNRLTAISEPISKEKLTLSNFQYGSQFIDYHTKAPVVTTQQPAIEVTLGEPFDFAFNTLQSYRHDNQDYNLNDNYLYYIYPNTNNGISRGHIGLRRANTTAQWNLSTQNGEYFEAPKGVPVAMSMDSYNNYRPTSYNPTIFIFDWTDGDINGDSDVDVADLQNVIYFAMNDSKPSGSTFNYSAADENVDKVIDVRDAVLNINHILEQTGSSPALARSTRRGAMVVANNTVVLDNGALLLNNNDQVAALQFTIVGARESDIVRGTGLPKGFSISAQNVPGGVKIIICSFDGQYLPQGSHALLKGLPAGSAVTDVRMADPEAQYLNTVIEVVATGISGNQLSADAEGIIYTTDGQRVGTGSVQQQLERLPAGSYIIQIGNEQFKIRK